jgi:hypothetical protein
MSGDLGINKIQLGDSGTATNNFVIEVPVTPDGTLKISRGNIGATTQGVLTVDASGVVSAPIGQIKFPATQNPSADANTLDDYEEGTWTPAVSGVALNTVTAKYTKVGNRVDVQAKFGTDATTGAEVLTITGLPFTAAQTAVGVCFPNNGAVLASRIESGSSSITFYYYSTAAQATVTQCAATTFVLSITVLV